MPIVDDHSINLNVLNNQLQHFGMIVLTAENQSQTLKILHEASETKTYFYLIILEFLMPEVNGAELGKIIINDPGIPLYPIVIYSSEGRKGDANFLMTPGFQVIL